MLNVKKTSIWPLESQFYALISPPLITALEDKSRFNIWLRVWFNFQHHITYKYLKDFLKSSSSCLTSLQFVRSCFS